MTLLELHAAQSGRALTEFDFLATDGELSFSANGDVAFRLNEKVAFANQ
jgi:hypothetical protein